MTKTILGRTGLTVCKDAFGALPVQRCTMDDAVKILRKALDGGINFIDSARGYTDSEEKIGIALSSRRDEYYIASKSNSKNGEEYKKHLETSLEKLKTSHIDIYQFHNPGFVPRPGEENGLYDAALEAKAQGKIRFIGISYHKIHLAKEAVESGLYDTLQFPLNYLSTDDEISLVNLCKEKNVGFIAMKALSGGLITDIFAARAWLSQFSNVVPIWGIQRESELELLLEAINLNESYNAKHEERVVKDRQELSGGFCRGCGYCLPCPAEIPITLAARISLLMRRSPVVKFLEKEWQDTMARIDNCQNCGHCIENCPYELDTPALLKSNYQWYSDYLSSSLKYP